MSRPSIKISNSVNTEKSMPIKSCMAQQFHNCLEVDTRSMLEGDLVEIWMGRTKLICNEQALVALFQDGSAYYRVNDGIAGVYDICDDDRDVADSIVRLGEIFPELALKVQECLFEAFIEEAQVGNSMSRQSC
jgi:hypothetical protein